MPADDDLLTVGINRAVDLLAESAKKKGRVLGAHPAKGDVYVKAGRYGAYVEHNKLRATLPKDVDIADVTLDQAIELLAEKAAKTPAKKSAKKAAAKKKAAPKKKAATKKKATAKKSPKKVS